MDTGFHPKIFSALLVSSHRANAGNGLPQEHF